MFWNTLDKKSKSIFDWIGTLATASDVVRCEYASGGPQYFSFAFPLHPGDSPKKRPASACVGKETFIISFKNSLNIPDEKVWTRIFSLPSLGVYEKNSRHSSMLPLRFGLSEEEKSAALECARSVITELVAGTKEEKKKLPKRFDLISDVGVAIWIGGILRGSSVVEKSRFYEGIEKAARGAGEDIRFKPLETEDLSSARIEVTCIGDVKVPLTNADSGRNQIDPGKGYSYVGQRAKGWYLPEVFNVRRFNTLSEFLESLAKEKAQATDFSLNRDVTNVFEFNVLDFVENENGLPVNLVASPASDHPQNQHSIEIAAHEAARWLMSIQEKDGNYPAVISLSGIIKVPIDWIRLACTVSALTEFGTITQNRDYLESAHRGFSYLEKHLIEKRLPIQQRALALSYMTYMAETMGNIPLVIQLAHEIERLVSTHAFEPILFSHAANSIKAGSAYDATLRAGHAELLLLLKKRFRSERESGGIMALAAWAELASAFYDSDQLFSREVSDWLVGFQSLDGSFSSTVRDSFPYVRGTAKIFEALALWQSYSVSSGKAAGWIMGMQYTRDKLYCVLPSARANIQGGFRHDSFNTDLWIDSAAHFLLGTARRMNWKATR